MCHLQASKFCSCSMGSGSSVGTCNRPCRIPTARHESMSTQPSRHRLDATCNNQDLRKTWPSVQKCTKWLFADRTKHMFETQYIEHMPWHERHLHKHFQSSARVSLTLLCPHTGTWFTQRVAAALSICTKALSCKSDTCSSSSLSHV